MAATAATKTADALKPRTAKPLLDGLVDTVNTKKWFILFSFMINVFKIHLKCIQIWNRTKKQPKKEQNYHKICWLFFLVNCARNSKLRECLKTGCFALLRERCLSDFDEILADWYIMCVRYGCEELKFDATQANILLALINELHQFSASTSYANQMQAYNPVVFWMQISISRCIF